MCGGMNCGPSPCINTVLYTQCKEVYFMFLFASMQCWVSGDGGT